jgi:hypothetical protein
LAEVKRHPTQAGALRLRALVATFLFLAFAGAAAQTPSGAALPYLEKDRIELINTLSGRWDNDRHIFFAKEAGMDERAIAARQHLILEPIENQPFQLRARRELTGQAPIVIVHDFSLEFNSRQVRQSMLAESGASLDCDVFWQRRAGGFSGTAKGAGCGRIFPEPKGKDEPAVLLGVADNEFWVHVARGSLITESRFRRARTFTCWTAILRGVKHGETGEGRDDWFFREDVTLHDQNGEAVLLTDETPSRKVRLKMRNADWPFGTRRPSLTLYIHEGEDERAVSYAWAEYDADRIGINLRWMQASCTRNGPGD